MDNFDSGWIDDNTLIQDLTKNIPEEPKSQEVVDVKKQPQNTIIEAPLNNQELLKKAKELPLAWFDNWKDLMEYVQYDLKADIDKQILAFNSFITNTKNPEQLEIAKRQLNQLIELRDKNTVSTTSEKKILASSLQVFKDQIKLSGWIWINRKSNIEKTNEKFYERPIWNVDIENVSLDLLSWEEKVTWIEEIDKISWITRKKFYDIKLDDIYDIYKNYNNWSDKENILESSINWLLKGEVMNKSLKGLFMRMRKNNPDLKAKHFLRKIRSIIRKALYNSVSHINSYIDETAKWKKAFNDYKNSKKDEKVWYLIKSDINSDFQKYVNQKKMEHNWTINDTTKNQRNYLFWEDIWIKINKLQDETNLSKPIAFWKWIYEGDIVYKKNEWDSSKQWLYIMWERYLFDAIQEVSDIIIYWEKVVIKWKRFWKRVDLQFTKDEFIDSIRNLMMHGNTDFEPIWDNDNIYLRKARL